MSDNIPFDIQLAIMNILPVKSLLQFRSVSKSWKYSIDCSDFVYGVFHMGKTQAVVGEKYIGLVIDMPEKMLVGQCLPPYYISQLGDCIIISGSFKFVDFSIIYAWELQVDDGEVSC
ncbi:F-box domain containing protein [Tanacetum coccineum]